MKMEQIPTNQSESEKSFHFDSLIRNKSVDKFTDDEFNFVIKNYEKLKRENFDVKRTIYQRFFRKYFPDIAERYDSKYSAGYIHLPPWHPREIAGKKLADYKIKITPELFLTAGINQEDRKDSKNILAQEYKIHLMPDTTNTTFIVEEFLRAMRNDEDLRDVIAQMKVINDDKKIREEILPIIVIYPIMGKENAQKALDKIYKHLGQYAKMGMNVTPRYNRKINDLIYYAQGSGNFKKEYKKLVIAKGLNLKDDDLFEPDLIHFKGDYKLKSPAE